MHDPKHDDATDWDLRPDEPFELEQGTPDHEALVEIWMKNQKGSYSCKIAKLIFTNDNQSVVETITNPRILVVKSFRLAAEKDNRR